MHQDYGVLVVGTGPAGVQVALGLEAAGYDGSIGLIGAEPALPYERPPLSKAYLTGELTDDALLTRPADFWEGHAVELSVGTAVVAVDPAARRVTTANFTELGYGSLVWAAGCRPRTLSIPGADLDGVLSLRSWADGMELRERLRGRPRITVVGGGYVGLEAAAAAAKLGAQVTVIETQDRLLPRVAGHAVAEFVSRRHTAAGVRLLTGCSVEAIVGEATVTGVRLGSGEVLAADTVLVGIGVMPNIEPLAAAGAACANGVLVDTAGRTSLPHVFAAGDCARVNAPHGPARGFRIESIQNAGAHARAVVATLTGGPAPAPETPWFWSNQYEVRLKTNGLVAAGYGDVVLRGDPDADQFTAIYVERGTIVAVDTVNNARDFAQSKALIGVDISASRERLADTSIPLKQVLRPALSDAGSA